MNAYSHGFGLSCICAYVIWFCTFTNKSAALLAYAYDHCVELTSDSPLAAKSTPLIFGRGNSSIGSFGAPSRRISDYDNTSNQQNEEWGVIQEQQQQQPLLVSRGSSLLVSSSRLGQKQQQQQQPKENPLLTRLLDAKSCSTRLSVGDSRLPAADGPQTEVAKPSSSVAIESNNFGTLAKAKVRAEKKVEEDAIKCIDSVDKGVENKVDGSPSSPDQDDKMLIDKEEEETSKENHKPQEDTSSSPLSTLATTTSRTTSTTSKWSQTIVNSCPWWITSFLPSASTESQAFLMSPSSSVAAVASSSPHTSSSRPRSNSSNNIPQKQLRFSTQQDIIPSPSYEVTSTDLKNSWLLATNIPTTLSNIQMISAHRGITVSYSLEAANIVGKTSMVHIEPTQLINRINLSKDRYRLAVLEEQERQREEVRVAAATEGEKEEMDDHDDADDVGENDESSGCNMDNVEKLGKVASIYSEWGVELALSRWWMER